MGLRTAFNLIRVNLNSAQFAQKVAVMSPLEKHYIK